MAIRNRFSELLPEITAWRRDIHENPELLFETIAHRNLSPIDSQNLAVMRSSQASAARALWR